MKKSRTIQTTLATGALVVKHEPTHMFFEEPIPPVYPPKIPVYLGEHAPMGLAMRAPKVTRK